MNLNKWYKSLTTFQKVWIFGATAAIFILGIISRDTPMNIAIGTIGMLYVSVYGAGARSSFLLGIVYVSLYTVICLQNRIMLDALQNIVLIPVYIASFVHWGKKAVQPKTLIKKDGQQIVLSMVLVLLGLFALSKVLHGNYSFLDSLNTTCTLYAMGLGYFGISLNWLFWSINNVASALVFGLALMTPTGSLTVFIMKLIFCLNGFISWYNWDKMSKETN